MPLPSYAINAHQGHPPLTCVFGRHCVQIDAGAGGLESALFAMLDAERDVALRSQVSPHSLFWFCVCVQFSLFVDATLVARFDWRFGDGTGSGKCEPLSTNKCL
jgi:hypothetical protein